MMSISLLGIILIQLNWIKNAALIQKEKIEQRYVDMAHQLRDSMLLRDSKFMELNLNATHNLLGNSRLFMDSYRFSTNYRPLSSKFTIAEVHDMIYRGLRKQHLNADNFDFGVIGRYPDGVGYTALQTFNFATVWHQALDSLTGNVKDGYAMQVVPLNSDDSNFLMAQENLFIVFSDIHYDKILILKSLGWMIIGSIAFTLIIIAAFGLTIQTMLNQKKISEIKSDFINNMTHELKTPLATISLAVDAIGNEKVMSDREKIGYFSGIIKEENKRMNKQVESILQSALIEKNEITLKLQSIDVHQVIQHTVDNLQLQLVSKDARVELQLDAAQPVIKADEVHFSNVIFNLLDNAIKYSRQQLEIKISTFNTRKTVVITIADNGIGMSRDTVSRIFEKFYRAHTGNVHNVKGFGMGLSYVKAIIEAHKARIRVESTLGKGSKFTMEFPQES